jgi:hypothetical protein
MLEQGAIFLSFRQKDSQIHYKAALPRVLPCCADTLWNVRQQERTGRTAESAGEKRDLSTSSAEHSSAPSPRGKGFVTLSY